MTDVPDTTEHATSHRSSTLGDLAAARGTATMLAAQQRVEAPVETSARSTTMRNFGLCAGTGVVLLIAGLWLSFESYDQRFIYDNETVFWSAMALIGPLLAILGLLLVPISIVGAIVVAIVRALRSPKR